MEPCDGSRSETSFRQTKTARPRQQRPQGADAFGLTRRSVPIKRRFASYEEGPARARPKGQEQTRGTTKEKTPTTTTTRPTATRPTRPTATRPTATRPTTAKSKQEKRRTNRKAFWRHVRVLTQRTKKGVAREKRHHRPPFFCFAKIAPFSKRGRRQQRKGGFAVWCVWCFSPAPVRDRTRSLVKAGSFRTDARNPSGRTVIFPVSIVCWTFFFDRRQPNRRANSERS